MRKIFCFAWVLLLSQSLLAQVTKEDSLFVKKNYDKIERRIAMRDGVTLFTAIYIPKDQSQKYPFLIERTPYSCDPYGENDYPENLSSNPILEHEKYIFVFQDVRGRYMSEGNFEEVTPHKTVKKTKTDIDESSDTFDTIDWLLKNIKNNNGKAGIYGISYPGFYATASLPDSHPALKAVSPQAPVTDEFAGDDAYHNGAFFLMDNFAFYSGFDTPRKGPVKEYESMVKDLRVTSAAFYKKLEPVSLANTNYIKSQSKIWNELTTHTTYDEYWQARNIRTHLNNVKPAVMIVGGWFDAEDLFGPLHTYEAIEQKNPKNNSRIVLGPWTHGAWARNSWTSYANYTFDSNPNDPYKKLEADFFRFYLKDQGTFTAAEATVFITGSNEWKSFANWPPKETTPVDLFLNQQETITLAAPVHESAFDEYISDPHKPVPYIDSYKGGRWRSNDYMGADQRYASSRPDVLTYQSEPIQDDVTLIGPLQVDLFFSTTGTDADFIVKLIDVMPEDNGGTKSNPKGAFVPEAQVLVRGDVLRGKFRNNLEKPEPFVANEITEVKFKLNDVGHTFKKGHRIMIQIQSSWFPLVDLNPQKFMDIVNASKLDFQKATHRIYTGTKYPSKISVLKLN